MYCSSCRLPRYDYVSLLQDWHPTNEGAGGWNAVLHHKHPLQESYGPLLLCMTLSAASPYLLAATYCLNSLRPVTCQTQELPNSSWALLCLT